MAEPAATTLPAPTVAPSAAPAADQPAADQPAGDQPRDASAIQKELEAANREAAKYRVELQKLRDAAKAADDAKLSEQEKVARERDELKAMLDQAEARGKASILRAHVVAAAARLGYADTDDAMRFVDASAVEWQDESPTNVAKLLEDVLKAKPYLRATRTQPPDHGAGPRGAGPGAGVSDAQIQAWERTGDHKAINENWGAVQEYLKRRAGRG